MPKPFSGWSEAAFDFYRRLEADNTRTFWLAHKTVYDDEVRAPFDALSELVADEFGELRVFRPNRDVRFSKDKSPYKTQCYAVGEGEAGQGFYVGISATRLSIGAGFWMMAPDQLARYRTAVDDARFGPTLAAAVAVASAAGLELEGQPLKTAPRGWPRDHPRIELLRCRSVAVLRFFEPSPALGTPAVLDEITNVWRQAGPVNEWLGEHVGPSTLPPPGFTRGG
jgi:uncharacterized protein (TIGR02453 family)